MNRLLNIGFVYAGHWKLVSDKPLCQLINHANTNNILYSFISNGEIKYVGKTIQVLQKRMYSYENPGSSQSTNIKNNKYIKEILLSGETVDIFVLPDNGLLLYGGFHLNLAAGLEDSLIKDISPPWNGNNTKKPEKKNILKKENEDSQSCVIEQSNKNIKNGSYVFHLTIQPTYYNYGFFNVVVEHEKEFGRDGEKIDIYCGEERYLINGYINRTATSNSTPRIMGGKKLKQWFQNNYNINSKIKVEVLSPVSIWLKSE